MQENTERTAATCIVIEAAFKRKVVINTIIIEIILITIAIELVQLEDVMDIVIVEVFNIIPGINSITMTTLNTYMNKLNVRSTTLIEQTIHSIFSALICLLHTQYQVLCYPNESNWEYSQSDGSLLLSVWKRPQGRHDSKHDRSESNYPTSYQSAICYIQNRIHNHCGNEISTLLITHPFPLLLCSEQRSIE